MLRGAVRRVGPRSSWRRRPFSSVAADDHPELGSLPLAQPAACVWGSNTGVGKTLFSAGLAAACRRAGLSVLYLKPAQTGFPGDSDARLVGAAAGLPLATGPHAAQLLPASQLAQQQQQQAVAASGSAGAGAMLLSKTLYAWQQPVSPHLAVETEGRPVGDRRLAADVAAELRAFSAVVAGASSAGTAGQGFAIVETAGGVASPGPSGSLQCDLLRTLRLPAILVGDGRLGGISATLSSYDSLTLRGHQVPLVVLMDGGRLGNAAAIQRHLAGRAQVLSFPECLPPPAGAEVAPGGIDASLEAWLHASAPRFDELVSLAAAHHAERVAQLAAAAGKARSMLWWPFTQHGRVGGDAAITVIEARAGENFVVYRPPATAAAAPAAAAQQQAGGGGGGGSPGIAGQAAAAAAAGGSLELMYDACASWWTQGVSEEAQPELVRAAAAAAARYGHVMFPENTHEPALELAKQLLGSVGKGWAERVFYTDNGSTAIEVALKMAFRKYMADHGLLEGGAELQVLGLTEGYHGDTLGAMDAVAPSPFNGRLQTPWYTGRGLFLEPPTAALQRGAWHVALPSDMAAAAGPAAGEGTCFGTQGDLLGVQQRLGSPLHRLYEARIRGQLQQHSQQSGGGGGGQQPGRRLGALILEPVLQGAGGMRLIDPLYQRTLVDVCREARIPVIFDEVFTGFYRLGATSGAALLGVQPDVACYAKLLTGGLLPLSATLATGDVFAAFEGDSKMHALLHGHSYTAHPIGCATGVAALRLLRDAHLNPNFCTPDVPGRCRKQAEAAGAAGGGGGAACTCTSPCGTLLPMWDGATLAALSSHPAVRGVTALGTVCAVQLAAGDAGGYASEAAAAVTARLHAAGVFGRPLGDVVYLMVTPMTRKAQCNAVLAKLVAALDG